VEMVNRPDKIGIADIAVFYVLKNGNGGNDDAEEFACLFGRRSLPAASREPSTVGVGFVFAAEATVLEVLKPSTCPPSQLCPE
jgi:hypothetical protein